MKIIFVLLCSISSLMAMAQQKVVITGTITEDTKGFNKVYLNGVDSKPDSVTISNGHFTFEFAYTKPTMVWLYSEYEMKNAPWFMAMPVIAEKAGTYSIDSKKLSGGLRSGSVHGSPATDDFKQFGVQMKVVQEEVKNALKPIWDSVPMYGGPAGEKYAKDYDSVNSLILPGRLEQIIASLGDSYGTA